MKIEQDLQKFFTMVEIKNKVVKPRPGNIQSDYIPNSNRTDVYFG